MTDLAIGGPALDVHVQQTSPIALDVAFEAPAGSVTALLGPSGSGKTTTLRMIAGLEKPLRGRISLGGTVWFASDTNTFVRPEQRRIGYVFQDYALFPHLNVMANVTLAMGHISEAAHRTEKASDLLSRLGIARLSKKKPMHLSGGERQRVAIARALARDPDLLLLDEPFSAVDRPTRERLKAEVRAVAGGLTMPILLVTHDIADVLALARNAVIIASGRVVASGNVADVLRRPLSSELTDIIGPLD